jgi:hypothetical protein
MAKSGQAALAFAVLFYWIHGILAIWREFLNILLQIHA